MTGSTLADVAPPAAALAAGPLQTYWLGLLPVGAAIVVVAWWLWRRGTRGRSVVRAVATTAVVATLAVLGCAGMANAYAGYVPTWTAAARLTGLPDPAAGDLPFLAEAADTAGRVTTVGLGDAPGRVPSSPVWIYTPPGYDRPGNTARYPVVYLLHGYPGTSADWFAAGAIDTAVTELIRAGAVPPVIVVAPDMNGGGLRDTEGLNVAGGPQIATYLIRTVPAWVDAHLRTVPDPAHRVIGGMSAGGFAALNLGLRHPQTFGGIIGLEGYGDPGAGGLAILGGNRTALAQNSPSAYLPTMPESRRQVVFIDVGGVGNTSPTRQLAGQLSDRGLTVRFQIEPGQRHTWREARAGIPSGLVFVARQLGWTPAQGIPGTTPSGPAGDPAAAVAGAHT